MQFIELRQGRGLRAVVPTYASGSSSLEFVLLPLVAVGEPAYYAEIAQRLRGTDCVVKYPTARRSWGWLVSRGIWSAMVGGRRMRLMAAPRAWSGVDGGSAGHHPP